MAEGKTTIKRVFGALASNQTAVEGAKYSPWWVALFLFILGLLLPVVPIFVNAANTNGTTFLSSYEYGLGLDKTFGAAINNLDGILTYNSGDGEIYYDSTSIYNSDDNHLVGGYVSQNGVCKGQFELRIYYAQIQDDATRKEFITEKQAIAYKSGTTTIASDSDDNKYIPSSIYFFINSFYMDIYASNSTEKKTEMTFYSDLNCLDIQTNDLKKYFVGENFDVNNEEKRINAYENLKDFIDASYKTSKEKTMLWGTLMYIGVYALLNMFMSLMLFLMSRGKNNPNNYLTFWTCMKIDWWACFCPGVLAMILGFIFVQNAVLFEVMLLAMRVVWLSTKELRPQYN